MKKILTIFASTSLVAITSASATACQWKSIEDQINEINGFKGYIRKIVYDNNNNLFVATRLEEGSEKGNLYKVNLYNNTKEIIEGIKGWISDLIIFNNKIYAAAKVNKIETILYTIDAKSNKIISQILDIKDDIHTLEIWQNKLYVGTRITHNQGKLYSINLENNKVLEVPNIFGEIDIIKNINNSLYIGVVEKYLSDTGKFYKITPDNNQPLEIDIEIDGTVYALAGNDQNIYVGTIKDGIGKLYKIDSKTNKIVSQISEVKGSIFKMIEKNNKLYISTRTTDHSNSNLSGNLYILDIKNDQVKTIKYSNKLIYGLAASDKYVYYSPKEKETKIYKINF